MVFIRQIHEFDLPALFTPQIDNIKVSIDHQILVIHRKGASIFALQSDPAASGPDLVVKRSVLPCPNDIESVSFGPNSSNLLLSDAGKDEILELLKNRLLTPRSYEGIEFNNYFKKAVWSLNPVPLESKDVSLPGCILATLTSNFQLILYAQIGPNSTWEDVGNVSLVLNQNLIPEWQSRTSPGSDADTESSISFAEYKSRLYQASIVDFTWMDTGDDNINDHLQLLTAQADGSLIIWSLVPNESQKSFEIEQIFTSSPILQDQVVSTMKCIKISKKEYILGIGTNSGTCTIYTLTKSPNFSIHVQGIQVWESDLLQINFLHILVPMPCLGSIKSTEIDILFVKHPNYLCTTRVSYCGPGSAETGISEVKTLKIPHGPIVGLDTYDQDLLMISHAGGMLSLVQFQNGEIDYEPDCSHSLTGSSGTGNKDSNRTYNGWALSRNKSLAFIGKNLNCYFDHNLEKSPAKLVVFSTLPENCAEIWKTVESVVAQNRENQCKDLFGRIRDVLVAFRHRLRTRKDPELYKNLENLPTTLQFLRLRLWILRAVLPPGDPIELTNRKNEVEELILQTVFKTMPDQPFNSKSKPVIKSYLEHSQSLQCKTENTRSGSICTICGEDMSFILDSSGKIRWRNQSCPNGHQLPISVFSLLPCGFGSFRNCVGCGIVGEILQPHGQEPRCPFCGEFMAVSKRILGTGNEDFEEEETDEIQFIDTVIT